MPSNSTTKAGALLGLALLLFASGNALAQAAGSAAKMASTPVPGPWPGVVLQVARVERIDDSHATLFLRFAVAADGKRVAIAGESRGGPPVPYDLDSALLVAGDQKCSLAPDSPYMSPSFFTVMTPGQTVTVPLYFKVPPPATPAPTAVLQLSRVAKPLENILIPNEITP